MFSLALAQITKPTWWHDCPDSNKARAESNRQRRLYLLRLLAANKGPMRIANLAELGGVTISTTRNLLLTEVREGRVRQVTINGLIHFEMINDDVQST